MKLFVLFTFLILFTRAAPVEDAATCEICEIAVDLIEDFMKNDHTQDEIIAYLESLCDYLPKAYYDQCNMLIAQYGPNLIQWILNNEDPATFCAYVQLCPASEEVEEVGGEVECTVCSAIMSYVEKWLAEGSTIAEIETLIEDVCTYLPDSYVQICDSIIEQYVPVIIQYLEQSFPPSEICALITLCDSSLEVEEVGGVECTICEMILSYVEKWLADGKTVAEIEVLLEDVCNDLPGSYAQTCDALVEGYVPLIVQYLESYPPDQICGLIQLCATSEDVGGIECTVCSAIISYVEQWLADGKTAAEIETLLEDVCGYLPGSYATECDAIISQYVPQIIQFITQDVPPGEICGLLGLCA